MAASIWAPGSAVNPLAGNSAAVLTDMFTATAGQTVFTLTNIVAVPGTPSVLVSKNGFWLPYNTYTVTADDTVTLNNACVDGDEIFMVGFNVSLVASLTDNVTYTTAGGRQISQTTVNRRTVDLVDDFGADPTGVAVSTLAAQLFFDYVTTNGVVGTIPDGDYLVDELVLITLRRPGFRIRGVGSEGARFIVSSAFTGATPAIKIVGTNTQCGWEIGGFSIRPSSGGYGACTVGFQVGSDSVLDPIIAGFGVSTVKDVFIADLPKPFRYIHARLVDFEKCSSYQYNFSGPNTCFEIVQSGLFTGDVTLTKCNLVNARNTDRHCISIISSGTAYNATTGAGSIAGVRINDTVMYAGDKVVKMYASGGSWIQDIWFNAGFQIDQEVNYGIYAESKDSGALIQNVHISDGYINKTLDASILFTSTGTGGGIRKIFVKGMEIIRPEGPAISFFGTAVEDPVVSGNVITDCNNAAGGAISFNGTNGMTCTGNRATQGPYAQRPAYLVDILSGTTNITCTDNDGKGNITVATVRDLSGDVDKIITGNIDYNPRPATAITVTASPFTYKNTSGAPEYVHLSGGTVTGLTLNGTMGLTAATDLSVLVPQGRTLTVTYTVAPTMTSFGVC